MNRPAPSVDVGIVVRFSENMVAQAQELAKAVPYPSSIGILVGASHRKLISSALVAFQNDWGASRDRAALASRVLHRVGANDGHTLLGVAAVMESESAVLIRIHAIEDRKRKTVYTNQPAAQMLWGTWAAEAPWFTQGQDGSAAAFSTSASLVSQVREWVRAAPGPAMEAWRAEHEMKTVGVARPGAVAISDEGPRKIDRRGGL